MRKCSVPLLAACLTLCAITPARAEEDKTAARELFRAGEAAFTRHEYRAAALAFEAADEKAASGGAMYNAAVAWLEAGEPARAADAFERALASGELLDGRLGDAKKRLAALERKLGVLVVTGPATVSITVAHLTGARPPRRVHLRPGDHVVHASLANGEHETRVVRVVAARETKVAVGAPTSSYPAEPTRPTEQPAPASDTPLQARSPSSPLGWILGLGRSRIGADGRLSADPWFVRARRVRGLETDQQRRARPRDPLPHLEHRDAVRRRGARGHRRSIASDHRKGIGSTSGCGAPFARGRCRLRLARRTGVLTPWKASIAE